MGIDAEMFVKTTHCPTQEGLESLRCQLGDAFGPESFFIKPGHPALRLVNVIYQDSNEEPELVPKPGEYFLEVSLGTRYYGEDYERGDFPFIYTLARWLEYNIPDAVVYYGGDSSGVLFEPFHKERREALMEHFLKSGHSPYLDYFDPQKGVGKLGIMPRQSRPACPSGDCGPNSLSQYGYGSSYIGLVCAACGLDVWTRDNGSTWKAGKRNAGVFDDPEAMFLMTNGVDWHTLKPKSST